MTNRLLLIENPLFYARYVSFILLRTKWLYGVLTGCAVSNDVSTTYTHIYFLTKKSSLLNNLITPLRITRRHQCHIDFPFLIFRKLYTRYWTLFKMLNRSWNIIVLLPQHIAISNQFSFRFIFHLLTLSYTRAITINNSFTYKYLRWIHIIAAIEFPLR